MQLDLYFFTLILDFNALNMLGSQPFYEIFWFFLAQGGWVFLLGISIFAGFKLFVISRQKKFDQACSWTLLAVDIPKRNEQSLKAVENIFSQLAGPHTSFTLKDKYWKGAFQKSFSLEIVSIDGYIQFLIRTPSENRDLIEAAFYAQYPDAEITEVADYAKSMNMKFPNEKYDCWAAEIILVKDSIYPIRTYPEFEDSLSQEFKDPMAALLEILSTLRKGEQVWLQTIITPTGTDWQKEGESEVNKMMGIEVKPKKTLIDSFIELPEKALIGLGNIVMGPSESKSEEKKTMMFIPPIQKTRIEGIMRKISKTGFVTKMRLVYLGKKEVFSKARGVAAVFGAIKQFNTLDLNAFKPDKEEKTYAEYVFVKQRLAKKQNRIFQRYIGRSNDGSKPYILNTEELATIYHFPTDFVKAPLVKKTEIKKAEPPMTLPVIEEIMEPELPSILPEKVEKISETATEQTLKNVSASEKLLPGIDFETDYFEKKFAKKRNKKNE